MKKIHYLALACLFGFTTFAQETIKLKVKENKVPCTGIAPMECLQVKEGKEKEWKYFYDNIEGYMYEPGYTYRLKVEKNKRQGTIPADASAYTYKLKKVVCKKKVKTSLKSNNLNIIDQKMILTKLYDQKVTNGSVYMTFNSVEQVLSGKSGVNRFSAQFNLDNDQLKVSKGMGTLMAGNPEAMKLERDFMNALDVPLKIVKNGNTVQFLNSKSNDFVMEFTIPTNKDVWSFIDGKNWKLFMLDNVGMDYKDAAIKFNVKENKVTGNNGCNNFFGSFSTSEDQITFEKMGSTRKACLDKDMAEIEQKIMKYLEIGTLRFDVAEQTVNFYQDNRLVMMFGLEY